VVCRHCAVERDCIAAPAELSDRRASPSRGGRRPSSSAAAPSNAGRRAPSASPQPSPAHAKAGARAASTGKMVKYSVLMPTYNERENLPLITYLLDKAFTQA
jgi:hypothetical protein